MYQVEDGPNEGRLTTKAFFFFFAFKQNLLFTYSSMELSSKSALYKHHWKVTKTKQTAKAEILTNGDARLKHMSEAAL